MHVLNAAVHKFNTSMLCCLDKDGRMKSVVDIWCWLPKLSSDLLLIARNTIYVKPSAGTVVSHCRWIHIVQPVKPVFTPALTSRLFCWKQIVLKLSLSVARWKHSNTHNYVNKLHYRLLTEYSRIIFSFSLHTNPPRTGLTPIKMHELVSARLFDLFYFYVYALWLFISLAIHKHF